MQYHIERLYSMWSLVHKHNGSNCYCLMLRKNVQMREYELNDDEDHSISPLSSLSILSVGHFR